MIGDILKKIPALGQDESKKKIILIYAGVFLAALILYFFLFLKPSLAALFNLIPKLKGLGLEIKTVQDDMLYEDKLKEKSRDLAGKLGGYEKKLSREKEIPELLESLSNMAKTSRVKIQGITPLGKDRIRRAEGAAGADKEKIYQEVPISITAQGGYHELGNFITKLESDQRFMQVSDIHIQGSKANPKRHEINIVVYAYTFKGSE